MYQILPIFLIMLLGGIFSYFNRSFNENLISELNKYAYYVAFPCLIIHSFSGIDSIPTSDLEASIINVGILSVFVCLTMFLFSKLFKDKNLQNTYFICTFFGNIAYLGIPVVLAINESYATSISLHVIGYLIVIFTIGITRLEIVQNDGKLQFSKLAKTILLNPLLLSSFFGILWMLLDIPLPDTISKSIQMIAASASPVVLFALGIFMVRNRLTTSSLVHAVQISSIKLLVLPFIFWVISTSLLTNYNMTVSIIMAGMPVAITPFVLADIYDMDKKTVANSIILSTILAILSIPLIVSWI